MKAGVVVIGAGVNGLTAAAYLGRAGCKVVVLERGERIGGLAAGEEFHPGFRSAGIVFDTACVREWVVAGLRLEEHGLRFRKEAPAVFGPAGEDEGPGLLLPAGLASAPPPKGGDAPAGEEFHAFVGRVGPFVRKLLDSPPPDLDPHGIGSLADMAWKAVSLRRLGRADMIELARLGPMCLADWLDHGFADPRLKALLAAPALTGVFGGPWSPGTAVLLLFHLATAGPGIAGGAPALVAALEKACRAAGVELRSRSQAARIELEGGDDVRGVTLADGTFLETGNVLATCSPRVTFLELLDPALLSDRFEGRASHLRCRGTEARIDLALDGPLEFRGAPDGPLEAARTGAHLDDLERAFDAVKYGALPAHPHLEIRVPSVADPSLAPPGRHVVSVMARCIPRDLEGGWTPEARERLGDLVAGELARFAPGVGSRILARRVLTPADLEERLALPGGHLLHAEPALDQLLSMRPFPECARYRTPVRGLFLGGSGSHPGGGLTGAPGALAARTMLQGKR
ncbi:MAG: phytoene desaturase family protein [Planctomycetota bacterium]